MKRQILTQTKQDYLRAIYLLSESGKKTFGITEIAKHLGLSKSTVSERLKELMRQKLVVYSFYSPIQFTKKGFAEALKLTAKHRTVEVFLFKVLKIPKSQIHSEAHKLEHAFSDAVFKKLYKFLGSPKRDPHGEIIPRI